VGPDKRNVLAWWREPEEWFVAFSHETSHRWVRPWWAGRYLHVSAIGLVERLGVWIAYNVTSHRTQIALLDDGEGHEALVDMLFACDVVKVPGGGLARGLPRLGFWCVPAVAHLVGVPSCALRPDAFLRDCLSHGGQWVIEHGEADG
jgi:hypothetical protein